MGSKVLGFLREFLLAYKFGASYITDAYIVSYTLTITFIGGLIGAFFTAYIPIYSGIISNEPKLGQKYNNKLLTLTLLIAIVFIILYYFFNDVLLFLIAPGFNEEAFRLSIKLSNILIFAVILNAIRSVVGGFLQYNNKIELVYSNIFILLNSFTILSIIFSSNDNPYILGYGYLLGAIIASLILVYHAYRLGFRYRYNFHLKDKYIKETLIILGPIFINIALMDISTLVDRIIASLLGEGTVSALAYAYKVNELMVVLFATTMGQAIFPHISRLIANNKINESMDVIRRSLIIATIIILPISVLIIFFSEQMITLLFMRGAFTKENVIITAQSLSAYSIGMIFFAYRQIIYRAMLSFKMSKYIMYNSIAVVTLNIVLNLILYKKFEHIGLALATSIATIIMCVLMIVEIEKKITTLSLKKTVRPLLKIIISTVIMVCIAKVGYSILTTNEIINTITAFLVSSIISGIVYLVILYLLKIEEVKFISDIIISKITRRK